MKVGIIGYGWVGRAAHLLFPNAAIHDINIEQYQDPLPECDIVFLAVPTPWDGERLDCSAVEAAIAACSSSLIVIRSATQPGFADAMAEKYRKRIVVQPEYLGESPNHPMLAMKERQFMILGGDPQDRRQVIDCYATVYNANITIRQVTNLEAEIIKLTENRAIFWKVLQCQELYDACEAAGVDYYTIRDAVYGDDPRMNLWWTFVYPKHRGANSKCLPKDVYAWAAWAESTGLDPRATRDLLSYNRSLTDSVRKMYILADGGLGNRLNSLIGGLVAAEQINCVPVICWPINNWCGCSFEDLFVSNLQTMDKGITDLILDDGKIYLIHDNQTTTVPRHTFEHSLESVNCIRDMTQDIVYFHNKLPDYFPQDAIVKKLRTLKILPHILSTVELFCKKHAISTKTKGIHIRKTDHKKQLDSDQIFLSILEDKDTDYFICSDDKPTEEKLKQLSNVKIYSKTSYVEKLVDGEWTTPITDNQGRVFSYNVNRSRQSVVEAFVDLLILSRTNISIKKTSSSFLSWATIYSMIQNTELDSNRNHLDVGENKK